MCLLITEHIRATTDKKKSYMDGEKAATYEQQA